MVDVLVGGKKREDVLRAHKDRLEARIEERTDTPTKPGPTLIYNNIEIETLAYRKDGADEKSLLTFAESHKRIRKAGYNRHLFPIELFSLFLDTRIGPIQTTLDDLRGNRGEWVNLAAHLDECTLTLAEIAANGTIASSTQRQKQFTVFPNGNTIRLDSTQEPLVQYLFGKPFKELPVPFRKLTIAIHQQETFTPLGFIAPQQQTLEHYELTTMFEKLGSRGYRPYNGGGLR